MLEQTITYEKIWATLQEPRYPVNIPTGYLLVLSALDKGWQIEDIEMAPSWDQNGFVYLVTLHHHSHKFVQKTILPKNPVVEHLLVDGSGSLFNQPINKYPGVHA